MLNAHGKTKPFAAATIAAYAEGVAAFFSKANGKVTIALHLGNDSATHFARSPELKKVTDIGGWL